MSLSTKEKEILERRKKLQAELKQIEQKLDDTVGQFKSDVQKKVSDTKSKLSPAYWIRKYPNYAIGAAVAIGFIAAPRRRRKVRYTSHSDHPAEPAVVKVREYDTGNMITSEIKRMLMHKATTFIVNKIEDAIDQNLNKKTADKTAEPNKAD